MFEIGQGWCIYAESTMHCKAAPSLLSLELCFFYSCCAAQGLMQGSMWVHVQDPIPLVLILHHGFSHHLSVGCAALLCQGAAV